MKNLYRTTCPHSAQLAKNEPIGLVGLFSRGGDESNVHRFID